ncbi:hypothetical protein STTU_3494 [Streptomyces sp. Tu6071]|nr:hypothetical protein STTU_3494 [Streptomyces sp. Tu6071]
MLQEGYGCRPVGAGEEGGGPVATRRVPVQSRYGCGRGIGTTRHRAATRHRADLRGDES